ncbi:MAG: Rieske (2Fe-2S) protein [Planctomycetota bacterium]
MTDWTDIADADDLPEGGRLCVSVNDRPLVVLRVDDTVYAIDNVCPHAGRPLDQGEVRGRTITCPYHGYAYSLATGANLDYPDIEPPLPTHLARISEGRVQVQPRAEPEQ